MSYPFLYVCVYTDIDNTLDVLDSVIENYKVAMEKDDDRLERYDIGYGVICLFYQTV